MAGRRPSRPAQDDTQQQAETFPRPIDINLTFGVEIEFILMVSIYPHSSDYTSLSSPYGPRLIHNALRTGLQCTCSGCGGMYDWNLPLAGPDDEPGYADHWFVGFDGSALLDRDEHQVMGENRHHYVSFPIEIQSRVLETAKMIQATCRICGYHNIVGIDQEIEAVLNRLKWAFNTVQGATGERREARIVYNESCGLHIHVGNRGLGFPFRTVKTVVAAAVVNEMWIDSLQATHRIAGSRYALDLPSPQAARLVPQSTWNRPWSCTLSHSAYQLRDWERWSSRGQSCLYNGYSSDKLFYPERKMNDPVIRKLARSYSRQDWVTLIFSTPTLEELKELDHGHGHHCVLNLDNMQPYNPYGHETGKVTFEFRQHASTLEATQVIAWLDFVSTLVNFCHYSGNKNFVDHVQKWGQADHNAPKMLTDIGCNPKTIEFYTHKIGHLQPGRCYADDLLRSESQDLDSFTNYDMTMPLRRYLVEKRSDSLRAGTVREWMNIKFANGGYGQFPAYFLDELEFNGDNGMRERLTSREFVPRENTSSPKGHGVFIPVISRPTTVPATDTNTDACQPRARMSHFSVGSGSSRMSISSGPDPCELNVSNTDTAITGSTARNRNFNDLRINVQAADTNRIRQNLPQLVQEVVE